MKELRTEIEIRASPEKVWEILIDLAHYPIGIHLSIVLSAKQHWASQSPSITGPQAQRRERCTAPCSPWSHIENCAGNGTFWFRPCLQAHTAS